MPFHVAPGSDGVSAQLLEGCDRAIAVPLELMWRSFEEGVVPSYYKLSLRSPFHKREDRLYLKTVALLALLPVLSRFSSVSQKRTG